MNLIKFDRQAIASKGVSIVHSMNPSLLSDHKTVHIFLVGTGLIGGTLLRQVHEQAEALFSGSQLHVTLCGAANSRRMIFDANGLNPDDAGTQLMEQGEPMNLEHFMEKMISMNLPNSIFIDCTASEVVADTYARILDSRISIVTPNKKANSGSQEVYKTLKQIVRQRGVRFLYETNVGAGLPVISTLNDLLLSGDKVIRIEAVLSGTLNFIFSAFTGEKPFSEIVREAKAKGYTEPDPRDDLSGMDVARKILILSRECGLSLELNDIPVQNLVPEDCREQQTTEEFLSALKKHDAAFEALRSTAEDRQEKLRYQAILEDGKVKVELKAVGKDHPFYSLSGSDNIILLTTERYRERPVVIRGPGAGAEVTAAGVFADIIRIGSRM